MAFDEIIGNEKIKEILKSATKADNVLHSYLFVGTNGIGKRLFAKEFAQMMLCESKEKKPCKTCKSCLEFQGESHPDFLQIEPEDEKTIKIEQIRYLQEKIAEKPVTSTKKVYIINNCDTMTREAANSLLKTLEEPPAYAILILITNNESKLLVTIKSRCTKVAFKLLSEAEIKEYFARQKDKISDNMVKQCEGSIGIALKLKEDQEKYEKAEEVISNLEKMDITQIWRNAEILYQSKEKIIDLLNYMNVIFLEKLRTKQDMKYTKAVSIVEETKKRITANANYDMSIDNLLLKLWEEFC